MAYYYTLTHENLNAFLLKNCEIFTMQVTQLSTCRVTLHIKVRFLANRIFEISARVENFASLRHTAQYTICFSV